MSGPQFRLLDAADDCGQRARVAGSDGSGRVTDIDVDTRRAAYESKNQDFRPFTDAGFAYRRTGQQLNELRKKLNTIAASGKDEIVVVVKEGQLDVNYRTEFEFDRSKRFPDAVDDIETIDDIGTKVESNFDGVEVTFKTYSEVE